MDEAKIWKIARVCHEANRAHSLAYGLPTSLKWGDAPKGMHQSSFDMVKRIIDNPTITDEQIHQAWMEEKVEDGWSYGPEKNYQNKTHPSIVPYDQLPISQKEKDALYRVIVECMSKF